MARVIRIDHIGIATPALAEGLRIFRDGLGLPVSGIELVSDDCVTVAFLPAGDSDLELLEPAVGEGPVQKFIASRGAGMHHICFEVDDLDGMLAQLIAVGIELIDTSPRAGAHGTRVAFIHPKSAGGVLIELVQATDGPARD